MDGQRPTSGASPPAIPRLAASVIVLREAGPGFELLLVKRNPAQRFMGGFWVFPGGAVDAHEGADEAAQRAAAVRELREEAGIAGVDPGRLVRYSRWITPPVLSMRFDTHFFLALAPDGAVARCDGHECVELRWATPRALLADYERNAVALAPPTLRQIEQLATFGSAAELIEHARTHVVSPVLPRVAGSAEVARVALPGEAVAPAPGDV